MDLTRSEGLTWRPVREGVTLAPLNMVHGAGSFLMRFEAGSRSPAHDHPGGEEIFVVSGSGRLNDLEFTAGDFIYTPPGEGHTLHAREAVVIHVVLPKAVVITE